MSTRRLIYLGLAVIAATAAIVHLGRCSRVVAPLVRGVPPSPAPAPTSLDDPACLALAERIAAPWRGYDDAAYVGMAYAVADLLDAVAAGHRPSPAGRAALVEAVNTLERGHGTDPMVQPFISRAREALERTPR